MFSKKMAASKSDDNMDKKKQQTPTKKFMFRVLKILLIFLIVLTFAITGIAGGAIIAYIRSAEPLTPDSLMLKGFTSNVYDADGKLIMPLYGDKNREMIDSKDIPDHLKKAFVAIEDKRFYEHFGIDPIRIGGAIINFIKPGSNKYGASTITQQVIKNITGEDQRSLKRKVQEWWRAIQLEKKLTKDQILEIYLNLIFMGHNCYGVESASKAYFNKDAKDLDLAECASLAGITNLPGSYDPFTQKGRENNLKRQKIILKEMLDSGFITQDEHNLAIKEEIKFADTSVSVTKITHTQPYFIDQVVSDVKKDLMSKGYSEDIAIKTIYNNGLRIYTTMDSNIQKTVDEVFTNTYKYFPIVNKSAGQPQGAIVILDPKTAQVRAMYGGAGVKKGITLNRASSPLVKRQPGSTFKPIAVYGPAINERVVTAATVIDDSPVHMLGADNKRYPEDYDHTYRGITNIHDAIRDSLNVVAAKTWRDYLGPDRSIQYLKKVNINREDEKYVSLSLGGLKTGVNSLQMAAAYVPFANKGVYYEPTNYTKVEDANGNILLDKTAGSTIVYDESAAYKKIHMLSDVVKLGTAYPYGLVQNGNIATAGKTGTTSDNKDKWFVGFSPYYVAATWYGYDTPTTLYGSEYSKALTLWHDVMEKIHANLKPVQFSEPSDIVKKTICIYSGKPLSSLCANDPRGNSVREELFIKGTEPADEDICDVHVAKKVCVESKDSYGRHLLAGPNCPRGSVVSDIFIRRKQPFSPINSDDPYPLDWVYEAPLGSYCNIHLSPKVEKPTPTPIPEINETPTNTESTQSPTEITPTTTPLATEQPAG